MDGQGLPYALRNGQPEQPDAILSRMRTDWISEHLEGMGIPVFNNSRVCRLCNDKRRTHLFLSGLPMAETQFLGDGLRQAPLDHWPRVVKPANGHGGQGVALAETKEQWGNQMEALTTLSGSSSSPSLTQRVVAHPGRDLRVYVLFGQILAGVLRTAKEGIVSNFKLGGSVELHPLTEDEQALAEAVIQRFEAAGAPLCMAGVDLLYGENGPVISEVEDVVGSRMLYQVSDIDIVDRYLKGIADRLG